MRYIGVSGSRSFNNYKLLSEALNARLKLCNSITIVSGGAKGADSLARAWAKVNKVNIIEYLPEWNKNGIYNPYAAFQRNKLIAEKCDELIACLVSGLPCNGTKHTINEVEKLGKFVTTILYTGV